ncbi:chondroitin AC/alginate lyase [Suillus subalutaceus]|uniref:chondroitin AC/alginate lyase n=1 Tax=Suillus subalutaceus TaxID=48586 RepID=UPI001B875964|nr:chondroitin AC/alginate lyase [Suillus subalutaceus]KAG1875583.1 chondroitin AC/alginate lyase [Suillus subalutaceus]
MATNYDALGSQARNSPYGSGDPYYNESSGYITPARSPKKTISKWVKFGVPVAVVVIAGAVLGGVLGSRSSKNASASSSAAASAAATSAIGAKNDVGIFATATDSQYLVPIYPMTTNTAAYTTPTFVSTTDTNIAWPQDPFQPSNPSPTQVRSDRPRLIAPTYMWDSLPNLIQNDPYLSSWNNTIFGNATQYYALPPVVYFLDGGNGILDPAREIKQRVKAFSYVYRLTNDTKWLDRTYVELQNAAGNLTGGWGPDNSTKWNPTHFLDTAELTAAYAIAYDWLYNAWTPAQRSSIMATMITYGLSNGVIAYSNNDPEAYGWWHTGTEGNWNCVCNNGLTMGALAILGDDTTGIATQLLALTIPDALQNCALAPSSDGTWSETANYWYFGTTAHAEMASSLLTATGSSYDLLSVNPDFQLTGQYHMYVSGPGSLFNYGDCGPNKYSTTANAMMFYGEQYNMPQYQLFQRDQFDAAEPWSMFWYNPAVTGAFWDGLALDHFFDNSTDQWGSMRSSWTDENALYVAVKAGTLQGHQTHNDLDCGDFVVDALGVRWFGELGSGDYNSIGYFSNDSQISERWMYYRKMTEGQNTILVNQSNQNVAAAPTVTYGTTADVQGSSTVMNVPGNSSAYFIADLASAYFDVTSFSRGVHLINGRKQVLIQDEINASASVMWRAHTNATVLVSSDGLTATLTIGSATTIVQLLNPPSGANFTTTSAVRFPTDPIPPQPDQPNDGVTVLVISLPAGSYTLEVLINPQWPGMSSSSYTTPGAVPLSQWSLTSPS